ncbi:hypothetical protein Tco_1368220 [Tanacetum coccineum]
MEDQGSGRQERNTHKVLQGYMKNSSNGNVNFPGVRTNTYNQWHNNGDGRIKIAEVWRQEYRRRQVDAENLNKKKDNNDVKNNKWNVKEKDVEYLRKTTNKYSVLDSPPEDNDQELRITRWMEFKIALNSIKVEDICSSGLHFTWTKNLHKAKMGIKTGILKNLDRVMSNEYFIKQFSQAHANFLPYLISDHTSAILYFSLRPSHIAEDASSKKFLVSNFTNYNMTDSRPVLEQYNELLGIHRRFTQLRLITWLRPYQGYCIIDKIPTFLERFQDHTLKILRRSVLLLRFWAVILRTEESSRCLLSDKPQGKQCDGSFSCQYGGA